MKKMKKMKKSIKRQKSPKKSPRRRYKTGLVGQKKKKFTFDKNVLLACHIPTDKVVTVYTPTDHQNHPLKEEHTFYIDTGDDRKIKEEDMKEIKNTYTDWSEVPSDSMDVILNCNCPWISTAFNFKLNSIADIDGWVKQNKIRSIWKNMFYDGYRILRPNGIIQIYIGVFMYPITDTMEQGSYVPYVFTHPATGGKKLVSFRTLEEVKLIMEERFEIIKKHCEETVFGEKMPPWILEITTVQKKDWTLMHQPRDTLLGLYCKTLSLSEITSFEIAVNLKKRI